MWCDFLVFSETQEFIYSLYLMNETKNSSYDAVTHLKIIVEIIKSDNNCTVKLPSWVICNLCDFDVFRCEMMKRISRWGAFLMFMKQKYELWALHVQQSVQKTLFMRLCSFLSPGLPPECFNQWILTFLLCFNPLPLMTHVYIYYPCFLPTLPWF